MRFSTIRTYDIHRYFVSKSTGRVHYFKDAVWAEMCALIKKPTSIQMITVISGSKTEKEISRILSVKVLIDVEPKV